MLRPILFLSAVCLALTTLASAQSLGELARLERERRGSESRKTNKIYTNDDFPVASASQASPAARLKEPSQKDESKPKEDRGALEKEWRQRFAEARARLREAEQRCWQSGIQTVFVGGGGLSGMKSGAAVPVQMQIQECVETRELRQAQKALAELEEELRRAGLPPGWARE